METVELKRKENVFVGRVADRLKRFCDAWRLPMHDREAVGLGLAGALVLGMQRPEPDTVKEELNQLRRRYYVSDLLKGAYRVGRKARVLVDRHNISQDRLRALVPFIGKGFYERSVRAYLEASRSR